MLAFKRHCVTFTIDAIAAIVVGVLLVIAFNFLSPDNLSGARKELNEIKKDTAIIKSIHNFHK